MKLEIESAPIARDLTAAQLALPRHMARASFGGGGGEVVYLDGSVERVTFADDVVHVPIHSGFAAAIHPTLLTRRAERPSETVRGSAASYLSKPHTLAVWKRTVRRADRRAARAALRAELATLTADA